MLPKAKALNATRRSAPTDPTPELRLLRRAIRHMFNCLRSEDDPKQLAPALNAFSSAIQRLTVVQQAAARPADDDSETAALLAQLLDEAPEQP